MSKDIMYRGMVAVVLAIIIECKITLYDKVLFLMLYNFDQMAGLTLNTHYIQLFYRVSQ